MNRSPGIHVRRRPEFRRNEGFSLLELLVVVAIIALIAAMLLPALLKAKSNAASAICVNNERQLLMAFKFYTEDNNGRILDYDRVAIEQGSGVMFLTLNGGGIWPHEASVAISGTGPEAMEAQTQAKILLSPLLNKYAPKYELLRCPADMRSRNNRPGTTNWAIDSYSRAGGVNGPDRENSVGHDSAILAPSRQYIFVEDADFRGFNEGCWMMNPVGPSAIDSLAIYHVSKTSIGFADGHVEMHKLRDEKTLSAGRAAAAGQPVPTGPNNLGPNDTLFMGGGYLIKPEARATDQ